MDEGPPGSQGALSGTSPQLQIGRNPSSPDSFPPGGKAETARPIAAYEGPLQRREQSLVPQDSSPQMMGGP